MKNSIALFILSFTLLLACKKQDSTPLPPPLNFTTYTILKGNHYADGFDSTHFSFFNATNLQFTAKFDSSAVYSTVISPNQFDVNKLYGFADNRASHHDYSARIGWAWYFNALPLFGYTYNNSIRTIQQIAIVPIGKEISCGIRIDTLHKTYIFSINGQTTAMPRAATSSTPFGYRLYPYFGGDEPAPHKVTILINE